MVPAFSISADGILVNSNFLYGRSYFIATWRERKILSPSSKVSPSQEYPTLASVILMVPAYTFKINSPLFLIAKRTKHVLLPHFVPSLHSDMCVCVFENVTASKLSVFNVLSSHTVKPLMWVLPQSSGDIPAGPTGRELGGGNCWESQVRFFQELQQQYPHLNKIATHK